MSTSKSRFQTTAAALPALLLACSLAWPPAASAHGCEVGDGMWHGFTAAALDAEVVPSKTASIGIWLPASGNFVEPKFKVSWRALPHEVNQPGDHKSLIDFERYESGGETFFAFVFSPKERAEELILSLAGDPALKEALEARKATQHLVDFEYFLDGGKRRWAALFAAGAGAQTLDLGVRAAILEERVNDQHEHLVNFAIHSELQGKPVFAALFDGGGVEQKFFANLEPGQLHEKLHALHAQGFRPQRIESFLTQAGDNHFAALFIKAAGDDHLWVQGCTATCQDPLDVATTTGHLLELDKALQTEKPSLRLFSINLPLGAVSIGLPLTGLPAEPGNLPIAAPAVTAQPASPAPAKIAGQDPQKAPPKGPSAGRKGSGDLPLAVPTRYFCDHSAVHHDGGTNGPPNP